VRVNEPLKDHTTYRIGGPATCFAEVETIAELSRLCRFARQEKVPFMVLGGGSNVLFGDRGFDGIVALLAGEFTAHRFEGGMLRAGAAARLPVLVKESAARDLAGLECLAGVPGTVGGALMSNAGTRDEWIGEVVTAVEVMNDAGTVMTIDRKDIEFYYRGSSLEGLLVTGVALNLKKGVKNDILSKINELMTRRSKSQPVGTWNAGSVFRNPPNDSAGRLIEACGLKGLSFGGAKVSEKHANFIINEGKAASADIRSLIVLVRQKVKEQFGVDLELEIKLVGE
jgi:UDP-N-acetylmuramate dehydrogenase